MKTQATKNATIHAKAMQPTIGEYFGMVLAMAGVGLYTYVFLINI